ncbi:MAG: hypothetical protein IPK03_06965 [Bacteroidetes bacterium]|nr:hypothetical protein [Bacteroidota bacterium]
MKHILFLIALSSAITSCSKLECIECPGVMYCYDNFSGSLEQKGYGTWSAFKEIQLKNVDCNLVAR